VQSQPFISRAFPKLLATLAVALAAGLLVSGCGGGSGSGSSVHNTLSTLCERTTDGDSGYCGCVADQVIKSGYDTDAEISQLQTATMTADQTGDLTQLPQPVLAALSACGNTSS
jgi:hypothetical protein